MEGVERERERGETKIENSMKLRRMRAYRIQLIHRPTWDFKIESSIGIVFFRKNCWTNEGCGKNLYGRAINELPHRGSQKIRGIGYQAYVTGWRRIGKLLLL